MDALQSVHDELCASGHRYGPWQRLSRRLRGGGGMVTPVPGLYMWGGVGRGKTYLMDLFYDCLPFHDKLRSHFHRFMHTMHAELKTLRGNRDPLEHVAERLARKTRVICFDEFFVSDIGDAMILANLFEGLFRRGVCLVATSNISPSNLYHDGLQRQRFLPAIDLIEKHTRVLEVDGGSDYRLRVLERAELYHYPLDDVADKNLERYFDEISPDRGTRGQELIVEERPIATIRLADGVVWFSFDAICDGPRSAADYIELARCYQTVLISDVPLLDESLENQARRFIALVDEFYDHNVKLILSAAESVATLYQGKRLGFQFQRTRSRLEEMQSHDYLASCHMP